MATMDSPLRLNELKLAIRVKLPYEARTRD